MKTNTIEAPNPRGLRRKLYAGLALLMTAGLFGGLALAVHDLSLFELDGNAINDEDTVGDDWDTLYGGGGSSFAYTGVISDAGRTSGTALLDEIFKGSADVNDISTWGFETIDANSPGGLPAKSNITNAYAAAYSNVDDDLVVYFGMDRLDDSGVADIGFWFLRGQISLEPDGCVLGTEGCDGDFIGAHQVGDILVASSFTQGGKVPGIEVYRWVGSGGTDGALDKISDGLDCADASVGDSECATVNGAIADAPWPYQAKSPEDPPNENDFPIGHFFEGGINLTALGVEGCFSTFLAETRTSSSLTSQLKDFAYGDFPVCGITVNKTDGDLSKVGDVVTYTIDIENTGRAALHKESIIDSLVGDLTDGTNSAIASSDCGASLAPGETCTITLSYTVAAGDVTTDDGGDTILENNVSIVYNEFGNFTGLAFNESDGHTVNLFEPAITFDKSGSPPIIVEGSPVNYTLTLDGASSADTPLLDCTITDIALGVNQTTALTSSGQVVINASRTWDPAGADAASCVLQVDETYDCTNTAQVSCEVRGFEGINALDKKDSVTVTVIPAVVALTVEKECSPYSKPSDWEGWTVDDKVDYTITIRNRSQIPLNLVAVSDSVLDALTDSCPAILAADDASAGGPDECVIVTDYTVLGSDPDPLINEVTVTFNDGLGANITTDAVSCSTDLVHPDLTLSKSCAAAEPVPAGASANFEIRITNAGDVNLNTNIVDDDFDAPINMDVLLGTAPEGGCLEGDYGDGDTPDLDAADGCLLLEGGITAAGTEVSNQVDVTATLPVLFGLSNVLTRTASDTCDVQQGDATRTWGFWKTHGSDEDPMRGYTCHVFEDHLNHNENNFMQLGWKQVNSCEDLFAIFWAHRARESDGGKRDNVCQAQVRCSGQVAAALLNSGLDNGAPLDADDLTAVIAALTNGSRRDINQACAPIAAYNESGDDVMIIDNDGAMIPHADPNGTRSEANYPFADCNTNGVTSTGNGNGRK